MSTGLTVLEGTMDETTGKGVLEGETPEAMAGRKIPMRIEIQREGDKETDVFYMGGHGGTWTKSMQIVYERQ